MKKVENLHQNWKLVDVLHHRDHVDRKWKDFAKWKYVASNATFFLEFTIKFNTNSFFELIWTLFSTGKKLKYFAKYKWKDFAKVEILRYRKSN